MESGGRTPHLAAPLVPEIVADGDGAQVPDRDITSGGQGQGQGQGVEADPREHISLPARDTRESVRGQGQGQEVVEIIHHAAHGHALLRERGQGKTQFHQEDAPHHVNVRQSHRPLRKDLLQLHRRRQLTHHHLPSWLKI